MFRLAPDASCNGAVFDENHHLATSSIEQPTGRPALQADSAATPLPIRSTPIDSLSSSDPPGVTNTALAASPEEIARDFVAGVNSSPGVHNPLGASASIGPEEQGFQDPGASGISALQGISLNTSSIPKAQEDVSQSTSIASPSNLLTDDKSADPNGSATSGDSSRQSSSASDPEKSKALAIDSSGMVSPMNSGTQQFDEAQSSNVIISETVQQISTDESAILKGSKLAEKEGEEEDQRVEHRHLPNHTFTKGDPILLLHTLTDGSLPEVTVQFQPHSSLP